MKSKALPFCSVCLPILDRPPCVQVSPISPRLESPAQNALQSTRDLLRDRHLPTQYVGQARPLGGAGSPS